MPAKQMVVVNPTPISQNKNVKQQQIEKPNINHGTKTQTKHENNNALTLKQIKEQIPSYCFQSPLLESTSYLIRDLCVLFILYGIVLPFYVMSIQNTFLFMTAYIVFICCVTLILFGIFVIGHDCGHKTFSSKYEIANDVAGIICLTLVLFPFYGWRYSHNIHHQITNNIEKPDYVWTPDTKSRWNRYSAKVQFMKKYGIFNLWGLMHYFVAEHNDGNHFNPWSPKLYPTRERQIKCIINLTILALWIIFLFSNFQWFYIFIYYLIPVLMHQAYTGMVTFLQHTHPTSVYFSNKGWDFIDSQLQTIDRSFGVVLDFLMHYLNYHTAHHLFFCQIPHYYLYDATKNMKSILGDRYKWDNTNWLKSWWVYNTQLTYISSHGERRRWCQKLQAN